MDDEAAVFGIEDGMGEIGGIDIPHLYAPVSRRKTKERFPDAVAHELGILKSLMESELEKAKSWPVEAWLEKAGRYVDVKAAYQFVFDEDGFGLMNRDGKVKACLQNEFNLGARFAKRLLREGAKQVLLSLTASSDLGVSWTARSKDPAELAQIFEIGF